MLLRFTLFCIVLIFFNLQTFTQVLAPPVEMLNVGNFIRMPQQRSLQLTPVPGPNFSMRSNSHVTCPCQVGCFPLPVTLLSFEGRRISNEQVLLTWKTENEIQNKGFEVESNFGKGPFKNIAFVPSLINGATKKKYELPDNNDFDGDTYYRLKQMDKDGGFVYSNTIVVKGYAKKPGLKIYPNPVRSKLRADIFITNAGRGTLLLMDAGQKIVLRQTPIYLKGSNMIDIPVSTLSAGLYFIKIVSIDNAVIVGKFVKQ